MRIQLRKIMARLRRLRAGGGRPAAGKHPTRIPTTSRKDASLSIYSDAEHENQARDCRNETARPSKKLKLFIPNHHDMVTRQRAKQPFRLRDLPPELRSLIYSFALLADEPLPLRDFKVPSLVAVSHQIRSEALPIFFATNTFTAPLRANWCVYARHWHSSDHVRFHNTGVVTVSPLLKGADTRLARVLPSLPEEVVRFHQIDLRIDCCCCATARQIGTLALRFHGDRKAHYKSTVTDVVTNISMVLPGLQAATLTRQIVRREAGFNGFTAEDVEAVALCFRYVKGQGETNN